MAKDKSGNIRGKILIGVLILLVIVLGVMLYLNRNSLGSSALTQTTSSPGETGYYVPNRDIQSDNWVPTPSVMKDIYYTLVDESAPNTTDYLTSTSSGSNNLIFAMGPTSTIKTGPNNLITVNVYAKAGYVPGVKSTLAVNISIKDQWQKAQSVLMGWENPPAWKNQQFKFTGNWTTSDLNTLKVKATAWGGTVSVSISTINATVTSGAAPSSPSPSAKLYQPETTTSRAVLAYTLAKAYSKSYSPTTPSFKDVPKTHWAYAQIEGLNRAGIMKGYGDGTFKPTNGTTRAELTVVLAKAAAVTSYDNPTPSFKDVPKTYWAYKEIEGMKKAGLISGYADGTYKPDGADTRATMAALLYRVKKITGTCTGKVFSDIPSNYWACKEVETVTANGWMNGIPTTAK